MKDNVAKWDLASRSVIPLIFKNKKFDNWKRITPFHKVSLYRIIETTLYFTRFLSIDNVAQKEIFIYEFALKVNNKCCSDNWSYDPINVNALQRKGWGTQIFESTLSLIFHLIAQ